MGCRCIIVVMTTLYTVLLADQKLHFFVAILIFVQMPIVTPSIKVDAVRARGATVILQGDNFDEAAEYAKQMVVQERLAIFLFGNHRFFQPLILAA